MSNYYDNNGLPLDVQQPQQAWSQQPSQPQYAAAPMQQPMQPMQPQFAGPVQQKSTVVAALLCFFFGIFGIHNFYLGHTNRGVIMLVLALVSVFTWWLFIGLVVLGALLIWELVDLIMILTKSGPFERDSRGVPLA
ncbi:MAG: TM2 domain-containing protein [Corynebacterium sp.]|uniref:TM2 domain-containing protein n=1 Tax=Corynebacterium sp. TaxID=1720 RepID=UPI0026E06A9E|nr:TM2 domain-containing protein [Corynebacterium sp.]MDO5668931.1 TM2 domain-containing protein [Corynebacterium sp.]